MTFLSLYCFSQAIMLRNITIYISNSRVVSVSAARINKTPSQASSDVGAEICVTGRNRGEFCVRLVFPLSFRETNDNT